jgi:hypothetical protein
MILTNPVLHIMGNRNNAIDMSDGSLVKPTVKRNPASENLPGNEILA